MTDEAIGANEKHVRRSKAWDQEFPDILMPEGQDIGEFYYRSECRPLKELKPLHRKGIVSKWHAIGSFREWLNLRDRARKDLYWLGKECIGTAESGLGFVPHVHQEMCDQFVKKNFDGVYHKNYTLQLVRDAIGRQDREKELLLLCPTGAYKSTANKIDAAQWMLNCPDIRIFILTGSGSLSKKFLKEVKGFFHKPSDTPYTFFQSLFPEYVIFGEDGDTFAPLTCPARIHTQPGTPTIWVNSIDGAIAGWHCDVWKGDDIVNEENSNNEETRAKLKDRYDNISQNRPDEWAFRDQLGTRYYPEDWYGTRIDEWKRYPDTNALRYLCRSAWTVKPGYEDVPIKKLQPEMVDLYFPEKMSFRALMAKCRQNERNFRCQQLNTPVAEDTVVHFEETVLNAHLIIENRVPLARDGSKRRPVVCWDTAHTDNSQSDYSAGAAGWCEKETRALYVLEIDYGKWKDHELMEHMVDLHFRWDAIFTEIEKFPKWQTFANALQALALARYNKRMTIVWREVDNSPGAKNNRVRGLEVLLYEDRLWFVQGDWIEDTFRQFSRFRPNGRRKDDIPDAVSFLQKLVPIAFTEPTDNVKKESEAERKAREARELREKFERVQSEVGYEQIFGSSPATIPDAGIDALSTPIDLGPNRLFGKTGLHL